MKTTYLFWLLVPGIILISCAEPEDYPIEPEIEYIGFNKLIIPQGGPSQPYDTLELRLSFTDGDGDIGNEGSTLDVIIVDSRTPNDQEFRQLPVIPEEGVGNGISGEIILRFPNQVGQLCCLYPDNSPSCTPSSVYPVDSFYFEVQIEDRSGNLSNTVRTETVTILCN